MLCVSRQEITGFRKGSWLCWIFMYASCLQAKGLGSVLVGNGWIWPAPDQSRWDSLDEQALPTSMWIWLSDDQSLKCQQKSSEGSRLILWWPAKDMDAVRGVLCWWWGTMGYSIILGHPERIWESICMPRYTHYLFSSKFGDAFEAAVRNPGDNSCPLCCLQHQGSSL